MSASVLPHEYEIYEVPANALIFIATSESTGLNSKDIDVADSFGFSVYDISNESAPTSISSMKFMHKPSSIRWKKDAYTSGDSDISFEQAIEDVRTSLQNSVKIRVETIPEIMFKHEGHSHGLSEDTIPTNSDVAVLFSGGIDSTLLAAMIAELKL
mmetsp:Transcript_15477/g.17949  ORF Transcript_15477/g.17949 Transcript_15477/m.17949 type:complete len:156 (+) Transcript_15477:321-788(+)